MATTAGGSDLSSRRSDMNRGDMDGCEVVLPVVVPTSTTPATPGRGERGGVRSGLERCEYDWVDGRDGEGAERDTSFSSRILAAGIGLTVITSSTDPRSESSMVIPDRSKKETEILRVLLFVAFCFVVFVFFLDVVGDGDVVTAAVAEEVSFSAARLDFSLEFSSDFFFLALIVLVVFLFFFGDNEDNDGDDNGTGGEFEEDETERTADDDGGVLGEDMGRSFRRIRPLDDVVDKVLLGADSTAVFAAPSFVDSDLPFMVLGGYGMAGKWFVSTRKVLFDWLGGRRVVEF